jgi:hypothetical protein
MVMTSIEILGFKSLADHWGLQRWRQKHSKGAGNDAEATLSPRTSLSRGYKHMLLDDWTAAK